MLHTLHSRRLGPQFCKYRSGGHQSSAATTIVKAEHAELLREIVRLGRNSDLKEIFFRINPLPLHSIVEAAIVEMKASYPLPLTDEKFKPQLHACPVSFSYMLDAFIHMKSDKVKEMIAYTKTEIILADHTGSECLFDACNVLIALDEAISSDKHEKIALLSNNVVVNGKKLSTSTDTKTISNNDNRRRHSLPKNANPIVNEFIINYTQWLLQMSSSQRYHHTVNIMCKSDKNLDRSSYLSTQIRYLHDELCYLKGIGKQADFTAIRDVQLSAFTAARMFGKIDLAVNRLKNKLLHSNCISKEAFSLAIYGCITGKMFSNDPLKDDVRVSRAALDALLGMADKNTFQCIYMRGIFLNVLIGKGFNNIVVEYATKFRNQGLLIGSRGSNCLISANIACRNFPAALSALDFIDFEENIVRAHGIKIFSEDPRPFQELDEVVNRFTLLGKMDYNSGIINKKIIGKVVNNNIEITKEMQSQSYLNKINDTKKLKDLNNSDLSIQNELNENKHITPEFGANLHSFITLIFSPYLNLISRNYFSDQKNNVGTENVFFNRRKVAEILNNLLKRMIESRIQPDARFLEKVIQIGKATGNNEVIFRVLTLAKTFYNSRNSWSEEDNLQPHTMRDSHIILRGTETLTNAEFQNSDLFYKNQNMLILTATEMSNFYEVAIEAKMIDEDIKLCEFLLYEMVQLNLSPTPTITKLIMGYYLKKERYEDVLRLFESVPAWGGYRNFLHGSMVILALTHMGRYSDAWRGAELLYSFDKFLSYDTARELFKRINYLFIDPDTEIPHINTGSKKKMSKKTKINAIAILIMSLLRFHPMEIHRHVAEETRDYVRDNFLALVLAEPEIAKTIFKIVDEKSNLENLPPCIQWVDMMKKNEICINIL